ncbi:hypothetical protein EGT72_007200 [Acinetobacter johnsonii]|jgi:DNA-binding transcriptional regulator YiaG|uniref:hypothetical protein n=1 Tax=Acinetobacter johnsonii TaxID=40214 RepID=UPI000F667374|nr:hypothetical protein [Acinetobacter johnsonii]QYA56419.1 hypothetical protein EGT72_007200 [Acinetobacter johnsonii]
MIDFNSGALTPLHILSLAGTSAYSGSVISKHVPSQVFSDPTGSLKINIDWLREQARSGQNYHIVEMKEKPEIQLNEQVEKIELQSNALEEKIELIKTVFSMTEVEIAQSIGVARKTLFNWKQRESAPNKKKAQNIFDLYLLAKNWKDAGFTTDSFELDSPVIDGQSIKDLLKEDKLDSEKILFAGNRLNHKNLDEIELF